MSVHMSCKCNSSLTDEINIGEVAQWVARLTRDQWIPVSREFEPIKGPHCFLEQETLL